MKIYIFAFFCISSLYLNAQDKINTKKKNQLELSTGYNFGALKNLTLAPLSRYEYNGLYHQLKYTRTTTKENLFEVKLGYLNSELTSDLIPELNVPYYSKIVLDFSYLKRVLDTDRFSIHAGLQTQTNISSFSKFGLKADLFSRKDDVFDFQQKLGITGRFKFKINERQSMSSTLTLPFLMWRTSTFEENFYSLNRYQSIFWSTEYTYKLSNHFDVKASYNFNYDRLQISNAYRELQHQINLGVNFKF